MKYYSITIKKLKFRDIIKHSSSSNNTARYCVIISSLGVEYIEESFKRNEKRTPKIPVELPFDPSVETPLEIQVYFQKKEFDEERTSVLENSIKFTYDFLFFCVKSVVIPLPLVGLLLKIEYSLNSPTSNCLLTV
jgi:hypothetical protein